MTCARVARLANRAETEQPAPQVDRDGLLRYRGRWVALSPVEGALAATPHTYLLARDAPDIARHTALLEPVPGRAETRVTVTPADTRGWRVEVASRDRPGLLATISGVLTDAGLSVHDALIATWGDGGAVDSFRSWRRRGRRRTRRR